MSHVSEAQLFKTRTWQLFGKLLVDDRC
ncbi:hypothetical protein JMJ77_0000481 [Colletotrichum scovillei]|uniref:Uncharacterized protein n=1 Tax=Colletotrichum scovillei TaxID=1209932 RepID=A0A9P7UHE0_9PEZI|nr:hypothetical protein JMJ77_0000481 [Colletotrichum scovillei]KAG7071687.1 hypothetical protein JMJ76_0004557 [Colletotrichum scovillei]